MYTGFERATKRLTFKAAAIASAVVLIIGAALTAVFMQGQQSTQRNIIYYASMEHSVEFRGALRMIFSNLQDAEAGQRGFLLTGDPEYLEPYTTASAELPAQLESLITSASEEQRSGAVKLDSLSREKLNELALTIATWRSSGPAAALEIVKAGTGKRLMDQIRTVTDEMIEAENQQVNRKSEVLQAQAVQLERTTLILIVSIVLLVLSASILVLRYIAHRREAEDNLRQAQAEAEEASRAKTDFLASMSHEIRTPLNAIIGYTELLFDQELAPDQRRHIERIHFAGSALLTIVNDVLDFSKIEAGRLELHPHAFSLEALIDNTVSIVGRSAQQKGLTVEVGLDPALPKAVVGDEARLRQILLNLLNNAVKFTHRGNVTLAVQGSPDADRVRFSVRDTGIGIPQDRRARMFQRFSQASASVTREFGGTGLGLAISKRLVDLMGGAIGFESQEGQGSTFWFEVPLPRAGDLVALKPLAPDSPSEGRAGRILLVEDLEHNRDLARAILTNAGHEVDIAVNGAEALAAVQAKSYDLVLMDVQMPVMDGVMATKLIRQVAPPASTIPIIAMSANVLPQQVRSFKEAGMNDHIGKPFKRAELFEKVNRWMHTSDREIQPEPCNAAIDELLQAMGPDWVASGLKRLIQQVGETFGGDDPTKEDREQLARRAHALVSHAALFGFAEVSQLCSDLEEACKRGRDLAEPFGKAKDAAFIAREHASTLLKREP